MTPNEMKLRHIYDQEMRACLDSITNSTPDEQFALWEMMRKQMDDASGTHKQLFPFARLGFAAAHLRVMEIHRSETS